MASHHGFGIAIFSAIAYTIEYFLEKNMTNEDFRGRLFAAFGVLALGIFIGIWIKRPGRLARDILRHRDILTPFVPIRSSESMVFSERLTARERRAVPMLEKLTFLPSSLSKFRSKESPEGRRRKDSLPTLSYLEDVDPPMTERGEFEDGQGYEMEPRPPSCSSGQSNPRTRKNRRAKTPRHFFKQATTQSMDLSHDDSTPPLTPSLTPNRRASAGRTPFRYSGSEEFCRAPPPSATQMETERGMLALRDVFDRLKKESEASTDVSAGDEPEERYTGWIRRFSKQSLRRRNISREFRSLRKLSWKLMCLEAAATSQKTSSRAE